MRAIRTWLAIFTVGLILSGATAFPLVSEVRLLTFVFHHVPAPDTLGFSSIAYGKDW